MVVIIAQVTQNMFETERAITFQPVTTEGEVSSVSGGVSRIWGRRAGALGIQLLGATLSTFREVQSTGSLEYLRELQGIGREA